MPIKKLSGYIPYKAKLTNLSSYLIKFLLKNSDLTFNQGFLIGKLSI